MGPTLDSDGYPTDETLKTIREWALPAVYHCGFLMEYVRKAWHWPDTQTTYLYDDGITTGTAHLLSTGGWSGNESLINAMDHNTMFWITCWHRSERGGHYLFVVPQAKEGDHESDTET